MLRTGFLPKHTNTVTQLIPRIMILWREEQEKKTICKRHSRKNAKHHHSWTPRRCTGTTAKHRNYTQRGVGRNRPNNHPVETGVYGTHSVITKNYTVDILDQQFHLYESGRPDRIIFFGTDEGFHFLSNSLDWCLDGTFKSSPVQFMQLHTVYGLTNH